MDDGTNLKQEKYGNNLERVKDQFKRWRESRVRGESLKMPIHTALVIGKNALCNRSAFTQHDFHVFF